MSTQSNQLTVYEPIRVGDPVEFIKFVGDEIAKSGAIAGCNSPSKGRAMVAIALSEGVSYLDLQKRYHMTDKGMTMKADFMRAELRRLGGDYEWITDLDNEDAASLSLTFRGRNYRVTYTIDQAKREGLIKPKTRWSTDPAGMLRARCTTKAIRAHAAEVLDGFYTDDEMDDSDRSEVETVEVPFTVVTATEADKSQPPHPEVSPSTEDQRNRIRQLAEQLGDMANLAVDVTAMNLQSLKHATEADANRLIDKYITLLAEKVKQQNAANKAANAAEEQSQQIQKEKLVNFPPKEDDSTPIALTTLDEIKALAKEFVVHSGQDDYKLWLSGKFTEFGISSLSNLSELRAVEFKCDLESHKAAGYPSSSPASSITLDEIKSFAREYQNARGKEQAANLMREELAVVATAGLTKLTEANAQRVRNALLKKLPSRQSA